MSKHHVRTVGVLSAHPGWRAVVVRGDHVSEHPIIGWKVAEVTDHDLTYESVIALFAHDGCYVGVFDGSEDDPMGNETFCYLSPDQSISDVRDVIADHLRKEAS